MTSQTGKPARTKPEGGTPKPANPVIAVTMSEPKSVRLKAMLSRPDGVSIEEISEAFGWQPHSSRAALSGLRKQGHTIERDKVGSVTVYRMVGE